MSRNKDRLGGHKPQHSETPTFNPLNFVAPTEFVELPSRGKGYTDDHPLCDEETIEIKFMTAKDEDILTSHTLLKKGIAIDRFIQNILVDKTIDPDTLLIGDKNAILVAARASGYGHDYDATITCPECTKKSQLMFDLRSPTIIGNLNVDQTIVSEVSRGKYITKMPLSQFQIEFRLLTGADERFLQDKLKNIADNKEENLLTSQFKRIITSIEGHTDRPIIDQYVDNMPTVDSRHFKICLKAVTPNIEIKETFKCRACSFEKEVDVPFGTDFFWPDL